MKHTLQSMYDRGSRWVKNAANFVSDHPLLMATGGLVGSALVAASNPSLLPSRGQSITTREEVMRHMPREAYASSNTFSERPVLLGNMRGI